MTKRPKNLLASGSSCSDRLPFAFLGELTREADDAPAGLFEARFGGGQRNAQVPGRARPKSVARHDGDVLARQQPPREILRTETRAANVQ